MSLLLDVPYSEKDEAKFLGARWNPELKKWYVDYRKDYPKFAKWILKEEDDVSIIHDHLYIIEGKRKCFKCKRNTSVIGFGIEGYSEIYRSDYDSNKFSSNYYRGNEIKIAAQVYNFPSNILDFLDKKYNYHKTYSNIVKDEYMANNCTNCNLLQGDFYLFEEVDSPFYIRNIEDAAKLILHKVPLKYDFITNIEFGLGYGEELLKEHAQMKDSGINF